MRISAFKINYKHPYLLRKFEIKMEGKNILDNYELSQILTESPYST